MASTLRIAVEGLSKAFTIHLQGGVRLSVLREVELRVDGGECVALVGPSGAGKSTLLRCIYGNYRITAGRILVRREGALVDLGAAEPRAILELRRMTMGYVSQFLRAIPRVPTLRLVMEPLLALGVEADEAQERAAAMLRRLNLREALWELPPATFSGGERQRLNIARCFVAERPILLLDEPTASLDAENREAVVRLIREARARGAALVGIFHDAAVREAVSTRAHLMAQERAAA